MQSQVYYLANPNQTQVIFSKILTQVITLYQHFVPSEIRNRRNIHLQKQPDAALIASYLWAIQEGCRTATESAIYRTIRHNLFPDNFPERSRYWLGYNATKKIHHYGIKFSVLVSDSGFPIDYVVTPASVSDGTVAFELLKNSPLSIIYGDKQVKSHLSPYGIQLISQLRKNILDYSWFDNYRISRLRKPVETVFRFWSSLESIVSATD